MKTKIKLAIASAFALGSSSLTTAGYAATAFGNMIVSADVEMSCTVTAGALGFATYDPAGNSDTSAVITSTCTHGGSAKITVGVGASPAAGSTDAIPLRQLLNASDATKLAYFVYQNDGRDTVWGNTAEPGVGFTAVEGANTATLYGRIAAGETATVGSYADSVSVTLTY